MAMRLVQLRSADDERIVAVLRDDERAVQLDAHSTRELALMAIADGRSLAQQVDRCATGTPVDLATAEAEGRLLAPIDHPDNAHVHLTGTGLTHLGSAEGRDRMHKAAAGGQMTDSMRMFQMGLAGGKPADGADGCQPEWFYKGDGGGMIATGQPLHSPAFALDGSEEPEIAGIYVIGEDGQPWRLGFALANEFSDHVTERGNYLWLAHSKLRPASVGPELLLGPLPDDLRGMSRILRDGELLWEKPFLSGESNMSHSIANLEAHHFKYEQFRRPGDVHVHFFGTATLSFADGVTTRDGDIFEITAPTFSMGLRNRLATAGASSVSVRAL